MRQNPLSLFVSRVISVDVLRTWRKLAEQKKIELCFHWPLRALACVRELHHRLAGQTVQMVRVLLAGPEPILPENETTDCKWQAFVMDEEPPDAPQCLNLVHTLDLVRQLTGPLTHVSGIGTAKGQNDPLTLTPSAMVASLYAENRTVGQLAAVQGALRRGELEVLTSSAHYRLDWLEGTLEVVAPGAGEMAKLSAAEVPLVSPQANFADSFPSFAGAWAMACALTSGQLTTVARA